jgi:hypothetical protein
MYCCYQTSLIKPQLDPAADHLVIMVSRCPYVVIGDDTILYAAHGWCVGFSFLYNYKNDLVQVMILLNSKLKYNLVSETATATASTTTTTTTTTTTKLVMKLSN